MTMSATFVAWAHRLLGSWVNSHQNLLAVLTAKLYSYPVHHFWRNPQRGLCLQSWSGHDGSSATERTASRTLPQSSCQERSRNASVALQTSQNWSTQQLLASLQSESNHDITFTSLLSRADEKSEISAWYLLLGSATASCTSLTIRMQQSNPGSVGKLPLNCRACHLRSIIMVALCNRADHYISAL